KTVLAGLVMACRFATWPTSRSPLLENATTDGVVRLPSALGMTTGSPPSMTATHEFVVPRSIPMILLIPLLFFWTARALAGSGGEGYYYLSQTLSSTKSQYLSISYSTLYWMTSTPGFKSAVFFLREPSSETGARDRSSDRLTSIPPFQSRP